MKRLIILFLGGMILSLAGCKKFSEFQVDPNKSTVAPPQLLLSAVSQQAFDSSSLDVALASRQMAFTDNVSNFQYYGWTRGTFDVYNNLRQVIKMEEAAVSYNRPEYIPLVKFYKAWYFLQLTQMFGDIPYSQALNGEAGISAPVYDQQEDIYLSILNELKDANVLITNNTASVDGDIIYGGSMEQWKRAINSLSLRVLMSLSLKESNTRIAPKTRFAEIVNNPAQYPLLSSNGDNAQLVYNDLQDNRYPFFNNNDLQTAFYMDETFVDLLKGLKDPRLFSFADKAPKFVNLEATDFAAYGGVNGSDAVNENNSKTVAGVVSKINPRFYKNAVNEPSIGLGYAEVQFILAEGVSRGWITGNAASYYQKGIEASMLFYKITPATIATYLAQPATQLPAVDPLKSIITQKYIASFMNSSWQPFYEQRRTGFPVFDVSGEGVLNNKMIPKRWMYPTLELQRNGKHVSEAISGQFEQGDNINGVMWLIKP
ncbi:SusD/RagB family nutrient-binding outer membrane lipoprotein [Pedobacter sp. AW31-3R]|uniref:SusD/RagB family nutrient-binding outer membrane lipoprotein n=1 Tax=Pedobacter sp. AW31-3R TaxID=3445781 RepID=UPI003F9FDF60